MQHLWSPWRMSYITATKQEKGCVFCNALTEPDGPKNWIIARGTRAFVILNRYPYTSGHLMVLPYKHTSTLAKLDPETRAEIMELTTQVTQVLQTVYNPQGFNIGVNQGEAAGAGIAPHIHMHVVPRWMGDTNFMTAVGGTRVMPEALADTWRRIKEVWTSTLP